MKWSSRINHGRSLDNDNLRRRGLLGHNLRLLDHNLRLLLGLLHNLGLLRNLRLLHLLHNLRLLLGLLQNLRLLLLGLLRNLRLRLLYTCDMRHPFIFVRELLLLNWHTFGRLGLLRLTKFLILRGLVLWRHHRLTILLHSWLRLHTRLRLHLHIGLLHLHTGLLHLHIGLLHLHTGLLHLHTRLLHLHTWLLHLHWLLLLHLLRLLVLRLCYGVVRDISPTFLISHSYIKVLRYCYNN